MSVKLLNESFERKFNILHEACSKKKSEDEKVEEVDDKEELHKDIEDKEVLTEVNEEVQCDENGCKEIKPTMDKKDLEDTDDKKERRKVECAKRLKAHRRLKEAAEEEIITTRTVKRPTTISVHRNKRNPHKYVEVHNDGYGHRTTRQYMQWDKGEEIDLGDTKFIQDRDVKNFTGDGRLHRMRKPLYKEVIEDDYELVESKNRKSRVKQRVTESVRRKRFIAESIKRRARRMRESAERPLDRNDIIAVFQSLARSQGFYGRLLRELADAKRNDPEAYEDFMRHLEKQHFTDDVDLIMYIEG